MVKRKFRKGDPVVYRKVKSSTHPGPRAHDIQPSGGGEDYVYVVDKFWIVTEVRDDGQLKLVTRTGKTHLVRSDDIGLRHASWRERLFSANRFPSLQEANDSTDDNVDGSREGPAQGSNPS
jgi:hypothetical protein